MVKRVTPVIIIGVLVASQAWVGDRVRLADSTWVPVREELQQKRDPHVFKALTLGQVPAGIDWLFLRFVQANQRNKVTADRHAGSFYELDLATDLDPAFYEIYVAGVLLLSILRGDHRGAAVLGEKGRRFLNANYASWSQEFRQRHWAESWRVPVALGYVLLFGLQDIRAASTVFGEATRLPDVPYHIPNLRDQIQTVEGQYRVAIKLVNFWLRNLEKDSGLAENFEELRRSLFVGQYLYDLNKRFSESYRANPDYQSAAVVDREDLLPFWRRFRRKNRLKTDPLGGELYLDERGQIYSKTKRERAFNLPY